MLTTGLYENYYTKLGLYSDLGVFHEIKFKLQFKSSDCVGIYYFALLNDYIITEGNGKINPFDCVVWICTNFPRNVFKKVV